MQHLNNIMVQLDYSQMGGFWSGGGAEIAEALFHGAAAERDWTLTFSWLLIGRVC